MSDLADVPIVKTDGRGRGRGPQSPWRNGFRWSMLTRWGPMGEGREPERCALWPEGGGPSKGEVRLPPSWRGHGVRPASLGLVLELVLLVLVVVGDAVGFPRASSDSVLALRLPGFGVIVSLCSFSVASRSSTPVRCTAHLGWRAGPS